jgi:hypothetical protein
MKRYSACKDINKLVNGLVSLGWSFRSGKKHGVISSPAGGRVTIPSTPSDRRAVYNLQRNIRHIKQGIVTNDNH